MKIITKNIKTQLVKIMGEEGEKYETEKRPFYTIGLRGIYQHELGLTQLHNSFASVEGCDEEELPGTSAIEVTADARYGLVDELDEYLDDALATAKQYGDTEYIAVVIGIELGPDVECNDPREVVLGDVEVVAYIMR